MPSILAVSAVTVLAATLAGPPAAPVAAPRSATPPEGGVSIDVAAVNGSGCPPGTVAVVVAPGNDALVVTYDDAYHAQVGVGARPTDLRKNCQLNIRVRVPEGYRYAINGVGHQGRAGLAAGASGLLRSNYYYAGQSVNVARSHRFTGPLEADWQTTDEFDPASLIFSPCGAERNLNINTELRVNAGTSDRDTTNSSLTMDSTTSSVYRFVWRTCD